MGLFIIQGVQLKGILQKGPNRPKTDLRGPKNMRQKLEGQRDWVPRRVAPRGIWFHTSRCPPPSLEVSGGDYRWRCPSRYWVLFVQFLWCSGPHDLYPTPFLSKVCGLQQNIFFWWWIPLSEDYMGCRQGAHSDDYILVSIGESSESFLYIIGAK